MRISVITYGTEGDTRPLIELCRGLIQAGHEVNLLTDRSSLKTAQAKGVPMMPLAGDIKSMFGPGGELAKLMKKGGGMRLPMAMAKMAGGLTAQWMRCFLDQAQGAEAVIFCGLTSFVGQSVAEYLQVPSICVSLWPITPTREFLPPAIPPMSIPRIFNRLAHTGFNIFSWFMFRAAINKARRELCGQGPRFWMWGGYPVLYGMSRFLVPPPADWDDKAVVCGPWSAAPGKLPEVPELDAFIAAGAPPVYVGFGSMAGFEKNAMLRAVIDAVAGRRALFFPGWSDIDTTLLPDNFFVLKSGPSDWVFPRCSMVIHHGGSGTTHSAARAGVPAIALPFAGNQFFWADRLALAGVAPPFVQGQAITAQTLGEKIAFCERPEVQAKAKVLGAAMATEDGIATAVAQIEKLVAEWQAAHSGA